MNDDLNPKIDHSLMQKLHGYNPDDAAWKAGYAQGILDAVAAVHRSDAIYASEALDEIGWFAKEKGIDLNEGR